MNKQELDNLNLLAKKYLGQEMEISISKKMNYPNFKKFKFIQIEGTIGFSEEGEEMNYKTPNGLLQSSDGMTKKIPLTTNVK